MSLKCPFKIYDSESTFSSEFDPNERYELLVKFNFNCYSYYFY